MTDFLSLAARTCARIIEMTDAIARSPRAGIASSDMAKKSKKIRAKSDSEENPRRLLRRASILRQSTAAEADPFCASPLATKSLPFEFDVASFCSELETIRAALALPPETSESPESSGGLYDAQEAAVAISTLLTPSHQPEHTSLSIEDDVANAVRLLGSGRMFRCSKPVSENGSSLAGFLLRGLRSVAILQKL